MGGLSGFKERKSHVLTAGTGAGANYQMRIHIIYGAGADSGEDMYCDSLCKTDFTDIRFTSSDEQTLLSYWLQSKTDSNNAVFWVKVTEDLDADKTIFVYYGNATATSLSSQANTFINVISGVVGAWNMEETVGTNVVDYSGNGNDGTNAGASIVDNTKFIGKKMLSFNGINNVVNTPTPIISTNSFSLLIFANSQINNVPTVMLMQGNAGSSPSFEGTDGTMRYYVNNNASIPVAVTPDIWVLWGFNWNETTGLMTLYKNGVDQGHLADTTNDDISALRLGAGTAIGQNAWKGFIAGAILFSSDLSASIESTIASYYPDVTLEAGKVLVRKYATTTLPTHGDWGTSLALPCYCSRTARMRRRKRYGVK
jgi:hypothetical protein